MLLVKFKFDGWFNYNIKNIEFSLKPNIIMMSSLCGMNGKVSNDRWAISIATLGTIHKGRGEGREMFRGMKKKYIPHKVFTCIINNSNHAKYKYRSNRQSCQLSGTALREKY